jgi:hypothetical protein
MRFRKLLRWTWALVLSAPILPSLIVTIVIVLSYATAVIITTFVLKDQQDARQQYVATVLVELREAHVKIVQDMQRDMSEYFASQRHAALTLHNEQTYDRNLQIHNLKLFMLQADMRWTDSELYRMTRTNDPQTYVQSLTAHKYDVRRQIEKLQRETISARRPQLP